MVRDLIDKSSEVTMNDVIIEGNIADDDFGAIANAGKLNLNEGTVIAKNTARRYSGLYSSESGVVNINKNANIYDNVDKQQPPQSIHSEGILNMDPSWSLPLAIAWTSPRAIGPGLFLLLLQGGQGANQYTPFSSSILAWIISSTSSGPAPNTSARISLAA